MLRLLYPPPQFDRLTESEWRRVFPQRAFRLRTLRHDETPAGRVPLYAFNYTLLAFDDHRGRVMFVHTSRSLSFEPREDTDLFLFTQMMAMSSSVAPQDQDDFRLGVLDAFRNRYGFSPQ